MSYNPHESEFYLNLERYENGMKILQVPIEDYKTFDSFEVRCPYLYRIVDEMGRTIPFIFNDAQLVFHTAVEEEFARSMIEVGVPRCQIVTLKPRQFGATTYTAIRNLDLMLDMKNDCRGIVLMHNDIDIPLIFDKYKKAFLNLPDLIEIVDGDKVLARTRFKPEPESVTGYQMKFLGEKDDKGKQAESWLTIRTAGAGDNVGKGGTVVFAHLCLGENSKIIKADGSTVTIKDIEIGDKILTGANEFALVKDKFNSGFKDTYKVSTWLSNEHITASKDHKFLTMEGWKRLEELTNKDYVMVGSPKLSNKIKHFEYEIDTPRGWYTGKATKKVSMELTEETGFLIGYYLAEGHVKPQRKGLDVYSSVQFAFHTKETYYEEIQRLTKPFVSKQTLMVDKKRPNRSTFTVYGRAFAEFINVMVGRTVDKHIPDWFFDTNEHFLRGVLRGFTSGDGSKNNQLVNGKYRQNVCVLCTTHEKIGRQLRRIAATLNIGIGSLYHKGNSRYGVKGRDSYNVNYNGVAAETIRSNAGMFEQCNTQDYTRKSVLKDGNWYVRVKKIEFFGREQTYDIEVDHKHHSFETVSGVVSNSESSNYQYYKEVMSSLKQQMSNPKAPKFVVNETTANGTTGMGEGYYRDWVNAVNEWKRFEKGEISTFEGYRPVFVKWYLLQKYRKDLTDGKLTDIENIDFGSPEMKKQFLEREKILMEQYNVPIEAINWYRFNIKENCSYRYADACRYYPTFPEDAFLATTNTFFDSAKMFSEKAKYELDKSYNVHRRGYITEDLEFVESVYGELSIKTIPDRNYENRYILSVDQSEGLETGDYTSMKVFDRLTRSFVAHWFGKMAEDEVAREMMKLGYFYNNAYLIPERNRATIINIIKPDGIIPYVGEIFAESWHGNGEAVWGWNTNSATRKISLDELYAYYRDEGYDKLYDYETLEQHLNFVRTVTGRGTVRFEASAGKSDDIVFADALCIVAANRIEDEIILLNKDKSDIEKLIDAPRRDKKLKAAAQTQLGVRKSVLKRV